MLIDLTRTIEVTDTDGTIINAKDGKPPVLADLCLYSLKIGLQSDTNSTGKEKNDRWGVIKRVEAALKVDGKIELNGEDTRILKERIGKVHLQPGIVGRSWELLDGQD